MQEEKHLTKHRNVINTVTLLRRIARKTDIFNPIAVKKFITSELVTAPSKNKYEQMYAKFAEANQLPYDAKYSKYKSPIPLIPSTKDVNTILFALREQFYTPIAIMSETAVEAEELHMTARNQINEQTGELSIIGVKGHANGTYKLSEPLAESLRRGIASFTAKAQYITKTVKLGQPDTIEQITQLANQGFEKYNEADGYHFFRILQI